MLACPERMLACPAQQPATSCNQKHYSQVTCVSLLPSFPDVRAVFWPREAPPSSTLAYLTALPPATRFAAANAAADYKACAAACAAQARCSGWTWRRFSDEWAAPRRAAGCSLHGGPPDVTARVRDTGALSGWVSRQSEWMGELLSEWSSMQGLAELPTSWAGCRGGRELPTLALRCASPLLPSINRWKPLLFC